MLWRAVITAPHTEPNGFAGDQRSMTRFAATYLNVAREAVASAFAGLVERGWLGEESAVGLAADWLFNNPNRVFKLGLKSVGG